MSYKSALIAAGAEVLDFAKFGSYSGMWFAKVRYNGETGYVKDWWGSCSYCDAFECEFSDSYLSEDLDKRMAEFGKRYLDQILPAAHYLPQLDEEAKWDGEAESAAEWIRDLED